MRYAFPQLNTKTRFQSYNIVRRVLERFGHTVTADIDSDTDVVLFSACDVTDMVQLRALRRKTDKPIVCGGSYAFNYWSAKAYSDIVWIGEIFEFAECKTLDEVAGHRSAYTGDDSKRLFASQRIDWELIPITQFSPKKIYYLGAVGCSNKCRFCFTSWTHRHQVNDIRRINAAIAEGQRESYTS